MTNLIPVLALLLSGLAFAAGRPRKLAMPRWTAVGGLVAVGIVAMLVVSRITFAEQASAVTVGYVLGFVAAVVASLLSRGAGSTVSAAVCSLGAGVACAAATHYFHSRYVDAAQLSLLVSLGLGAIVLDAAEGSTASLAALAAVAVVSADQLGLANFDANAPGETGSLLGVAAAALGIVAVLLDRAPTAWVRKAVPVVLVAGLVGVGYFIGHRWTQYADAWKVVAMAVAAGVAVHWMMSEEASSVLRLGLATVIWCALATLAYGILKSYGVALALAGASFTLLMLGNLRALASLAPLATLTFYRLFRTSHEDVYQAIDIGQHYALVGFTIGAVVAMLPLEWLRSHPWPYGNKAVAGMLVWMVYAIAMPALIGLMLGEKGTIGFLVGLGLSPLIAAWHDRRSLGVLSMTVGLGALTMLIYDWMEKLLDLSREDKIRDFEVSTVALVIGGLVLAYLAKGKAQEVAA